MFYSETFIDFSLISVVTLIVA